MSRFFVTGDTDTESSTESSDEEVKPNRTAAVRRTQYMVSDDEEDEKRVVRSQKDKRYDELKDIIKSMRNSQKIRDIVKLQTVFETLQKVYQKARSVFEQEGGVPKFFISALVELEDFIQNLWDDKETKQKLSKINAKALASLKQKVRKYNKDFEDSVNHCRENPELYEEDEEEEEEEFKPDQDSEEEKSPPVKTKVEDEEGMEFDDSSEWDMTESDSSSESDSGLIRDRAPGEYPYTAEYFLKKKPSAGESVTRARKREMKEKKPQKLEGEEEEEDEEDESERLWETVHRRRPAKELTDREKMKALFGKDKIDLDVKVIATKRNELVLARGKKGTNKIDQLHILQYLLDLSADLGVGVVMRIYLDIIEATLDVPIGASAMKEEIWKICLEYLEKLLDVLDKNPDIILSENVTDEEENYTDPDKSIQFHGSMLGFVERIDDELTKILQNCDAHSTEYLTRLKDERSVTELIEHAQRYLENQTQPGRDADLCRIYMRRIDHLYYKVDQKNYGSKVEETGSTLFESKELITTFAKFIYSYPGVDLGPIKTRAVLCHIYHHAIHDRWFQARDLMLMTHLQEGITHADVPTQILYNRTIVQLGMCAFRHGMIKDAHDALMDMHSPPRPKDAKELAKELLAQGLNPRQERTVEQEKQERRRQVPFHMHINLELMECVYLTSAMLLEIPYIASTEIEGRRRMISKGFYHQLKHHEKQPLVGPPETMREHVVAAANAMKCGDWKKCRDYILDIKAWNLFVNAEQVKEMLTGKVQEESLRTYIFTYGRVYDTLSLVRLSEMFELPISNVHSIVSKMIIKEELLASLDEPTQSIVLHHAEPSNLQSLALNLAEKIGSVADHNEELLKVKQGPGGIWMAGAQQAGFTSMSSKPGGWGGNRRRQVQVR